MVELKKLYIRRDEMDLFYFEVDSKPTRPIKRHDLMEELKKYRGQGYTPVFINVPSGSQEAIRLNLR